MARASLRRYDVQAKVSVVFSAVAATLMLGLLYLVFFKKGNFQSELGVIIYSRDSMYAPVIFVLTAVTLLLAAAGAAMGINSAGQRRNHLSKRSWIAFFIGVGTISITIVLFVAFWLLKQKMA